jgi:hypothetical protein
MASIIRRFRAAAAVLVVTHGVMATGCMSHRETVEQRDEAARAEYPGKRYETVTARLGEPVFVDEMRAIEAGDEFRAPLWNIFPPNDPVASQTLIREAHWPSDDDFLVIWFSQTGGAWIAVDAAIMDTSVDY